MSSSRTRGTGARGGARGPHLVLRKLSWTAVGPLHYPETMTERDIHDSVLTAEDSETGDTSVSMILRAKAERRSAADFEHHRIFASVRQRLFGVGHELRIGRFRVIRQLGVGGMGGGLSVRRRVARPSGRAQVGLGIRNGTPAGTARARGPRSSAAFPRQRRACVRNRDA